MNCKDKVKYTFKEAEKVKKNRHYKKKLTIYLCPTCKFYHLTSQEPFPFN